MATFEQIQEEIKNMLTLSDDELSDEQKILMDDYLSELAKQEATKIDNFCAFIREQSYLTKYYAEESKRLNNKAKNAENRINYLKSKYLATMQENGISKIKGNAYTLSIRHTPRVIIDDDAQLDDLYVKIVPETRVPDKRILAEALKGGVVIPGCRLEQTDSLQIR